MVGCGMGAGLRIGELRAIEIEDVHLDSEDPYLTVKYGGAGHVPTKGRRTRRVELFELCLRFLANLDPAILPGRYVGICWTAGWL